MGEGTFPLFSASVSTPGTVPGRHRDAVTIRWMNGWVNEWLSPEMLHINVEIIIRFSHWGYFLKVSVKAYSFLKAELLFSSRLSVQLRIRTFASSGLIYYVAHQNQVDYATLQLHGGRPHFLFDLGKGTTKISHPAQLNDGKWHTVHTLSGSFWSLLLSFVSCIPCVHHSSLQWNFPLWFLACFVSGFSPVECKLIADRNLFCFLGYFQCLTQCQTPHRHSAHIGGMKERYSNCSRLDEK